MIKILYLPLKKEWYELIEKGIKPEDYRLIDPYWAKRLTTIKYKTDILYSITRQELIDKIKEEASFKRFDAVRFSYGYTKRTMTYICEGIEFGKGQPEWGAPEEEVFIIKRGLRLI